MIVKIRLKVIILYVPNIVKICSKREHVAQGKNTNNVVVSSRKYKGLRGFCPRKN